MSRIVMRLVGLGVHGLAVLAGVVARRLDRVGRALTGQIDAVDQHHTEARHACLDGDLVHVHRPGGGVLAVPPLPHVEVLDDTASGWTLGQALGRYFGEVELSVGDDLAALLEYDGVLLARKLPAVSQKFGRSEIATLADRGVDVSQIPPERRIGADRGAL